MTDRMSARHPEIAEYYRGLISSGRMGPGERLPTVAAIAESFSVSPATANKAVKTLADERLVYSNPQGTYVAPPTYTLTPYDRAIASLNRRQPLRHQETARVTFAGPAEAVPGYIYPLLGVTEEEQVVRREAVYTYRGAVEEIVVSWHPPAVVERCPELALDEPIEGGTLQLVRTRTGRTPVGGDDFARARRADEREARLMGIAAGDPVLAIVGDRRDSVGVIEYVECVYPEHKITHYRWTRAEA